MKKLVVDNCSVCDPINNVIEKLTTIGFEVLESKLEDYHFHQMYFKVNARANITNEIDTKGFTITDNFLICDCHWSRIEFASNETTLIPPLSEE